VLVRDFEPADDGAIAALLSLAFGVSPRAERLSDYWSQSWDGTQGHVAELDGQPVGFLRVRDYRQYFGGAAVPMGGISSVGVEPHVRRRGVASALLTAALADMRTRGQVVSALFQSAIPVYRRTGWENAGTLERVRVGPHEFAALPRPSVDVPVRRAEKADLPAIHAAYTAVASTVDGTLDRATKEFRPERVLELDLALVADPDVRGYLTAARAGEALICHDVVAADPDTALSLLGSLASWSGQLSEVELRIMDPAWWQLLRTRPTDYFPETDPWMLRVVDLPAAVAARGWPAAAHLAPLAVDVEVHDEQAPWHTGRHRLVADGGTVTCEPGGSGAVRLAARALGPWYAGSADSSALRRAGLLDGDPDQSRLLDVLTGAPHPVRMADSF
jgi:predicted acetyltransferase